MANKSGRLAAVFPDTVSTWKDMHTPGAGFKSVGQLRAVNQSGTLQTFRYAITDDSTTPGIGTDANCAIFDLPLDPLGAPFTEGIVVGSGQHLWIMSSSLLVAFQLNGRTNTDA